MRTILAEWSSSKMNRYKIKKREKVEKLYKEYGPIISSYLKNKLDLKKEEAEDVLQDTFSKINSSIVGVVLGGITFVETAARGRLKIIKPLLKERAWVFTIATNTAHDFIKKKNKFVTNWGGGKKTDDEEQDTKEKPFENLKSSKPTPEKMLEEITRRFSIRECYKEAIEKLYPHAICPLVVALFERKRPIEEIAQIISKTVPETDKLLKKCCREMRSLKKASNGNAKQRRKKTGVLEQCRDEKKGYKDYYNDYQTQHSRQEGAGSLCWLIAHLLIEDMTLEEIGKVIDKTQRTTEKTWE